MSTEGSEPKTWSLLKKKTTTYQVLKNLTQTENSLVFIEEEQIKSYTTKKLNNDEDLIPC